MNSSLTSNNVVSLEKMVEVINEFPFSIDFFYWLAKDALTCQTIAENIYANIYDRISKFYLDKRKVYTGGCQMLLNKVNERLLLLLTSKRENIFDFLEESSNLDKRKTHDTLVHATYTVISQVFYKGEYCGSCWEIYHLPSLIESYSTRLPFLQIPF